MSPGASVSVPLACGLTHTQGARGLRPWGQLSPIQWGWEETRALPSELGQQTAWPVLRQGQRLKVTAPPWVNAQWGQAFVPSWSGPNVDSPCGPAGQRRDGRAPGAPPEHPGALGTGSPGLTASLSRPAAGSRGQDPREGPQKPCAAGFELAPSAGVSGVCTPNQTIGCALTEPPTQLTLK